MLVGDRLAAVVAVDAESACGEIVEGRESGLAKLNRSRSWARRRIHVGVGGESTWNGAGWLRWSVALDKCLE